MINIFSKKITENGKIVQYFGIKNDRGHVIVEPTYKYNTFGNGFKFLYNEKLEDYFGDVLIYNYNGKEIGRFEEFYPFNEDGLAIVKSRYNNFFGRYSFFTKKGKTLGAPFKGRGYAEFSSSKDLIEAIETIGAVAIKYANNEIFTNKDDAQMKLYKEALKKYIFSTGVIFIEDKTEIEIKRIIHKEYDSFNLLMREKLSKVLSKDEKEERKNNLTNFINDLIK